MKQALNFLSPAGREELPAVRVLVVTAQLRHAQAVARALPRRPVALGIEYVRDAFEAVRRAREQRAHLVVVDAEEPVAASALQRHFERVQPAMEVFLFGSAPPAWPWAYLGEALDLWLALHLHGIGGECA